MTDPEPSEGTAAVVAIDLGTTVSVVATRLSRGPARILAIDGETRSPSLVAVDDDGHLRAGAAARAIARRWPERACLAPTRHLGEPDPALIAGQRWEFVDLVAALVSELVAGATRSLASGTGPVHLTYPAGWSRARCDGLAAAARRCGIPEPVLVPAPVAAVLAHAAVGPLSPGATAAVLVLGATSAQAALVRADDDGRPVVAGRPAAREGLGAALFDELLSAALAARLGDDAAKALAWSDAPGWAEAAVALGTTARQAKERLSEVTSTEVLIEHPDGQRRLTFTRAEFDQLIHAPAVRAVGLLRKVVVDAGVGPTELSAVHLAGGGGAVPLISTLASQALGGIRVVRHPDPGAALAAGTALVGASGAALRWTPTTDGPDGLPALGSFERWGVTAASRGARSSSGPATVTDRAATWPAWEVPSPSTVAPPGGRGPKPPRRWRRPLAALAAVVAVVGVAAGAVLALNGGSSGAHAGPLSVAQLGGAVLGAADVGQGFTSQPGAGTPCGSPSTPLASKDVVLSDPGYGELTEEVLSYPTATAATAAAQVLQDAAPACLGSTANFAALGDVPATCQSSWGGAGPVTVNGNTAGTATGYAGVFRCGTAVGLLLAYPEQSLEFTNTGFFQLFQDAAARLDALHP